MLTSGPVAWPPFQPSLSTSAPPAKVIAPTKTVHTIPVRLGCTLRFLLVDFVVLVDLVEALREFEDEDGFRAKGATPVGGEQYRKSADASASLQDLRDMPDSPRNHGKSVERFCACVTTVRAGPIRNIPLDAYRTCVAGASRAAATVRFKLL